MEEKILALLSEEFPEIDFTASNELVDDGILDHCFAHHGIRYYHSV